MPRAGVTTDRITDEAAQIANERGLDQVTLALIAERLGVRVPSLYKHIAGLGDVHALLAERSRIELAAAMEQATIGRSGAQAIVTLATAVRSWAKTHPGQYTATIAGQQPDLKPTPGMERATTVFLRVITGGRDTASDDEVIRARALRSAIHGYIDLELHGGFGLPTSLDDSFAWLVESLSQLIVDSSTNQDSIIKR